MPMTQDDQVHARLAASEGSSPQPPQSPAGRMAATMAAARVSFTWLGTRKTLTADQKAQAAETFGAEGGCISAAKALLDTRCPAFRAVTGVRNQIIAYWRAMTLPYPEPGIRLIRQDRLEAFHTRMTASREELMAAVDELDAVYDQLRSQARRRLGSLYNPSDYPPSLAGLFDVSWDFPSVSPPEYLRDLNPELYRQQRQLMIARFEAAAEMAQQAFTEEFARLIAHLTGKLTGGDGDGKAKVFRDSAVGNIREFFERFRELNVTGSADLERLVASAQQALKGVGPQMLRDDQPLRQRIASELAAVSTSLDGMLVDKPRRRILRPSGQVAADGAGREGPQETQDIVSRDAAREDRLAADAGLGASREDRVAADDLHRPAPVDDGRAAAEDGRRATGDGPGASDNRPAATGGTGQHARASRRRRRTAVA